MVPATRALVDAMLAAAQLRAEDVITEMPSRKMAVTAEKVAINAVMAGCLPEYMPVVVAAVKRSRSVVRAAITSLPAALAPVGRDPRQRRRSAQRLGINATNNVFGPAVAGERERSGRELRLVLLNCLK